MIEPRSTDTPPEQRVVLVGLQLHGDDQAFEEPLAELERLAHTAGGTVVGRVLQRRHKPDSKTFIGKGKVLEVAEVARREDAHLVLFDNDLTPAQERNLEESLGVGVVDRSRLILDIFALRARTREARLQVELAQLEYTRSRLKRMWTHLERLEGAIGTRGPGEKQIEEDRRLIDRRIQQLRRALDVEEKRRETRAAARAGYFTISLVGYTNAGKSTLLRELTGAHAFVEDKLFATLDTQTRAWDLPGNQRVFLSDTVGFIRDLPHHLVASFRSTLAEAAEADLLLHVVDASSPDAEAHIRVVNDVLDEIGAGSARVLVLNKMDAVRDALAAAPLVQAHPRAVPVSAATGEGLAELAGRVSDVVQSAFVPIDVRVPASAGRLLALLADSANVLERRYDGDEVLVRARASRRDAVRIRREMERLGLPAPGLATADDGSGT
mgnify:CR=1 FL=1